MALRSLPLSHGIAGTSCSIFSRRSNVKQGPQLRRTIVRGSQEEQNEPNVVGTADTDADFEARLARIQRKVTSGTGKKAEARKARKEGRSDIAPSSGSGPSKDLFIPSVSLADAVADGLPVELGMKPYVERLHGRLAALGLAAVLLVELATGDSLLHYHESGVLFLQVYTVIGLAAVYVKFEKEKISVWPK